jgi:hypothetical protein
MKAARPTNHILILTGNELFSDYGPPFCWKNAGGALTVFAEKYNGYHDLLPLCDATQQLYLDMKPWYDRTEEKIRQSDLKHTVETGATV